MNDSIPGLLLEKGAGAAMAFYLCCGAIVAFFLYLIRSKGQSPNLLFEGFLICLLGNQFLAFYSGQWQKLTMEWDFYFRRWIIRVSLILIALIAGAAILYFRRGKREKATAAFFIAMLFSAMAIYNVMK